MMCIGSINVVSRSVTELSADELLVPASSDSRIGVAMDNARLFNQTAQYARQMEIASQVAEEARQQLKLANTAKTAFLQMSVMNSALLWSRFMGSRIVQSDL
jgi:hypothetical protein